MHPGAAFALVMASSLLLQGPIWLPFLNPSWAAVWDVSSIMERLDPDPSIKLSVGEEDTDVFL